MKLLRPLSLVAATLAASTAMASVTFYETENFGGGSVTMDGTVPSFVERGFNDRALSAVVDGAPVEVCIDINFGGGCTVLNPGRYPTLGNLARQISSMRTVRDQRGGYAQRDMTRATFYEEENFGGRQMTMEGTVPNFVNRGFNDRALSAVVDGAPVEVCIDVNFGGGCTVLNPGRYPTLGNLGHQISSMRPIRDQRAGNDQRDRGERGGRWASATLYSGPNMTGRAVTLDREGAGDLQNFNDRASSLVVERGYWIFCSEPQFRGECRTFGPGQYSQLPPNLDNRILSGRRISNNYPYAQTPNWEYDR